MIIPWLRDCKKTADSPVASAGVYSVFDVPLPLTGSSAEFTLAAPWHVMANPDL